MSSIGYFSAVSGSGGQASKAVIDKKNPGGAIRGYMPQQNQTVDKQFSEFEHIRFTLKNLRKLLKLCTKIFIKYLNFYFY